MCREAFACASRGLCLCAEGPLSVRRGAFVCVPRGLCLCVEGPLSVCPGPLSVCSKALVCVMRCICLCEERPLPVCSEAFACVLRGPKAPCNTVCIPNVETFQNITMNSLYRYMSPRACLSTCIMTACSEVCARPYCISTPSGMVRAYTHPQLAY